MKARLAYVVVLATVCFAQMASAEAIMFVDVPFNFTAEKTEMPAGRYVVSRITENTLALRPENGGKPLFVLTNATERTGADDRGELVFDRFGSRYFLAEVWTRHSSAGRALHIPKTESRYEHDKVALNAASK